MTIKLLSSACIIFAAGVFYSCGTPSKKENRPPALDPREGRMLTEEFGNCDTIKNSGVSVSVHVWQPIDSGMAQREIAQAISKKVVERINSYADSASIAAFPEAKSSLTAAYKVFSTNYKQFKKQFPETPGCWEIEVTGDSVMMTPRLLFYQFDQYSFTGGAHPNSFRSFHIFDISTGREADMQSLVSDSVALLRKVEQAFRKEEKLEPDANLEQAGYFLADHRFFLPANYTFTRKGLFFYYNPYEIAAYARGPITFTIPYSELNGIVKTEMVF